MDFQVGFDVGRCGVSRDRLSLCWLGASGSRRSGHPRLDGSAVFFAEECLGKCRGVLGTNFDFIVRGIMIVRAERCFISQSKRFPHPRSAVSSSVQLRREPTRLYYQLRTQQEPVAFRNCMSMPGCTHLPLEMANTTPIVSPKH